MIVVENLTKSFGNPPSEILHGLSFEIPKGSFVSITGKSGSGKSTLLYSISTLDTPTSGKVIFDQTDILSLSEKDTHEFRNLKMGFIFQFHYLLPELTALENVLMPARRTGIHLDKEKYALDLLHQVGIGHKADSLPRELSGGEQQRVAIARALIMNPQYLFADEPTGNLDSQNGLVVMDILKKMTKTHNTTVVFVTHDQDFAALANRRIHLVDGKIDKVS